MSVVISTRGHARNGAVHGVPISSTVASSPLVNVTVTTAYHGGTVNLCSPTTTPIWSLDHHADPRCSDDIGGSVEGQSPCRPQWPRCRIKAGIAGGGACVARESCSFGRSLSICCQSFWNAKPRDTGLTVVPPLSIELNRRVAPVYPRHGMRCIVRPTEQHMNANVTHRPRSVGQHHNPWC